MRTSPPRTDAPSIWQDGVGVVGILASVLLLVNVIVVVSPGREVPTGLLAGTLAMLASSTAFLASSLVVLLTGTWFLYRRVAHRPARLSPHERTASLALGWSMLHYSLVFLGAGMGGSPAVWWSYLDAPATPMMTALNLLFFLSLMIVAGYVLVEVLKRAFQKPVPEDTSTTEGF